MVNDSDPAADRRREAGLRRVAAGLGLAVRKSRTRDPDRMDFGCYRVVRAKSGEIVAGKFPYGYSLSLDAVEDVLEEHRTDKTLSGLDELRARAWDSMPRGTRDVLWRPEWKSWKR